MTRTAGGVHVALLAVIAAYFLIFPVYRGFFPLEIAPNESWDVYLQDMAFGGGPLYPPRDALIVNNYPPLSFYLIGWIATWAGDALYIGRALSVAAIFGLAFVIAVVIRQLGAGAVAAAVGAAWFVATMAGPFNQFVAMDDPQLFAQFLMGCGLAWFLARDARGRSADLPVLLMVFAGFFKHNVIAIPATVLLWLILRDGRRAIRPCLVGLGGALLGLALFVAIYGDVFIANLLAPRAFVPWRMFTAIGRLQFALPALVIWAIWAWHQRRAWTAQFSALFIGIALVAHIAQWSGDPVVNNSQFDLVIATAIGLGLAYDGAAMLAGARNWRIGQVRAIIIAVVALRLMATGRIESALILFDPDYRALIANHAAVARAEAARIAAIPGPVACDNKLVCRMAGKAFVVHDFKAEQLINTGALTAEQLKELLRERGIAVARTDARAGADSIQRDVLKMGFSAATGAAEISN
jgi:hypothetical protein